MPHYKSNRERWRILQNVLPLFYSASLLPIGDDVDDSHSGASDDVDRIHLQYAITALRTDLKLNMLKQSYIDIENDAVKAVHENSEYLGACFDSLFDAMETFINKGFPLMPEDRIRKLTHELVVIDSFYQRSTDCFLPQLLTMEKELREHPGLLSLREALREHKIKHRLPHDRSHWINQVLGNSRLKTTPAIMRTGSVQRMAYTLESVQGLSKYICFPRDYTMLQAFRCLLSEFDFEMESITSGSATSYRSEVKINRFTTLDVQIIAHVDGFGSACTSLFTQIADNTACGKHHEARLHLSGFKKDQLKMDIETCQFPSNVSAVFTRSFDRPPNETFDPRDICLLNSSNRERPGALHVAFDQNVMWIQNTGGETEIRSSSGREEALDRHLGNWHSLPFMHRKLVSVLLASSMFQLSDTPWIEPRLDPAWIFLPMPIDGDLHQWCPRIYCNLESRQAMSPQSDNIAALGIILMELEGLQKSEWCDRDQDWISGQRSNHFRLFRMLEQKEWQDCVTDDCRQIARACLEFDGLVDDLEHPKIFGQRKSPAVFYKYILEPLCVHAINGFGNLKPLFKGMFGGERLSVPSTSTHLAATKSLILFDDDNSVANEKDKDVSDEFRENLKSFFKYIGEIGQLEPTWEEKLPRIRIAVLDSGVDDGETEIHQAIKFGQINEKKSKTFIHKQGGTEESWRTDTYGHGTKVTQLLLETAPAAEIFVCRISTGKVINQEYMPGIAEAINWATNECDADIISLSFGYEDYDDLIEKALENAVSRGKLIIAAASNNGGLKGRSRPASREGVLCIHATDGLGNKGRMNPSPLERSDNFATLGVAVLFHTKKGDVRKSGTSFATPIAVGFAAAVLEFARWRKANGSPISRSDLLGKKRGMEAIFRAMAKERDRYDFLHPHRIWGDKGCKDEEACTCWREEGDGDKIAKVIEDVLSDL